MVRGTSIPQSARPDRRGQFRDQPIRWHVRICVRGKERVVLAADIAPGELHAAHRTCAVGKDRLQCPIRANLVARVHKLHARGLARRQKQHTRGGMLHTFGRIHRDIHPQRLCARPVPLVRRQLQNGVVRRPGAFRRQRGDTIPDACPEGMRRDHAQSASIRHAHVALNVSGPRPGEER